MDKEVIDPAANVADPVQANATEHDAGEVGVSEAPAEVNERLLQESKKYKSHYQKLKAERDELFSKLEERQNTELAEQGKYKELYEAEKREREAFQRKVHEQSVDSAIRARASKLGCKKPEMLLRLGNPELLQYDESNGEVHGVDMFIEEVRKDLPELFGAQSQSVINPSVPRGSGKPVAASAEDTSGLSVDQIKAKLKQVQEQLKG